SRHHVADPCCAILARSETFDLLPQSAGRSHGFQFGVLDVRNSGVAASERNLCGTKTGGQQDEAQSNFRDSILRGEKQTQGPSTPVSRAGENAREPSTAQDDTNQWNMPGLRTPLLCCHE